MVPILVVVSLLNIIAYSNSANILVFEPIPSVSHHFWNRALTVELANRGHNVTSLSCDLDGEVTPNLHYIHLENCYLFHNDTSLGFDVFEMGEKSPWENARMMSEYKINACNLYTTSNGFKQLLAYPDNFKVDLVLNEYVLGACMLGFLHKFNDPPMIGMTSFNPTSLTTELVGSFWYPSYIAHTFFFGQKTSFIDRIENYLIHIFEYTLNQYWATPKTEEIMRKFFPGMPSVPELQQKTKLILINIDPAIDPPEPLLPNVIPVGGMQVKNAKPLKEDLKTYIDNSKNGVILFSLGTNMKSDKLGVQRQIEILTAFGSIPEYNFLWKFESDNLPIPVPSNVFVRSWMPQNDILAHPKTILFISHCGLLSTHESTWHGVPILGVPIFADQFLNIEKSVRSGVAEKYDIRTVQNATFRDAILNMIEDPKYRRNMKIRSNNFRDKKETPLEKAVWWTEWVLRNPDVEFLKNPTINMSIFQRQSIDVIAFVAIVCFVAIYFTLRVILYLVLRTTSLNTSTKSDKLKIN